MSLLKQIQSTLEKRQQKSTLRRLTLAKENQIDFSSNDYLSLIDCTLLHDLYQYELAHCGMNGVGMKLGGGGSRLLDGNSTYAEQLEREIADFHNAPTGLLFNSGFDANVGLFSCLPQPGDIVIYDEYIHASVHDGMRLSRAAKRVAFNHNSISSLTAVFGDIINEFPSLLTGQINVFIAVESIYSMDGDEAPLKEIINLTEALFPKGNAHLIVDEAHATGVCGPNGKGLVCSLNLENKVFARTHTFGKALASGGAIILTSELVRSYLINYARPLIYSTMLGFYSLAAIKASYNFIQTCPNAIQRQSKLWQLVFYFHNGLKTNLLPTNLVSFSKKTPKSCIFSLQCSQPRSLAGYCQARGIMIRPIVYPTVPKGKERVRVCIHAGNSEQEIDRLISAMNKWIEENTNVKYSKL